MIRRAVAFHEVRVGDWWRVAARELPDGLVLGAILGVIGVLRLTVWQLLGFPVVLRRLGFDPARSPQDIDARERK